VEVYNSGASQGFDFARGLQARTPQKKSRFPGTVHLDREGSLAEAVASQAIGVSAARGELSDYAVKALTLGAS
jgi:hypothetical protein